MTVITVDELRAASDHLLRHLEDNGVREIEIAEDCYWDVPPPQRYDPYADPTGHTLGQLSDDATEIRRMLAGETPTVGYALVWLAALLRRVGETSKW